MWVILLDRSSSMGDPFSATEVADRPGRKRKTDASTKWEAAKEAVLSEVGSLQPTERVLLFAFNDTAVLVFDGTAAELSKLKSDLESIKPGNGTNLAAGLWSIHDHLSTHGSQHIAVEVISDGLSELEPARDASVRLARIVALIEVILIDPTEEGISVANAIVQRGKVTSVSSGSELATELSQSAQRQATEQQRVFGALAKAKEQREATVSKVSQGERLSVTVGYPGSPMAATWHSLVTYLHLPSLEKDVQKRMASRSREAGQRLAESSSHIISMRGTWFTIVPRLDGVQFNPPQQEVAWHEDIQEVPFRFRPDSEADGKSLVGGMEVWANGVCITLVPVALKVGGNSWTDGEGPWDMSSGAMFEEVFASYSSNDRRIVDACGAAYKALGIHLFVDKEDLLGGQEWHPAIRQKIVEADAFELFWSTSSSKSHYVEDEWRHAMSLRGQKGHRFLRPFYWQEPKPDAPEELNRLNFSFLDLNTLADLRPPEVPSPPDTEESSEIQEPDKKADLSSELLSQRARNIHATVVPLLAGESRQSLATLRIDLSRAVAFLEDLTGLRYYPVPTLIVDEFSVRQAREARNMVDELPEQYGNDSSSTELNAWNEVLRALLLEFHTKHVPPLTIEQGFTMETSTIPSDMLEALGRYSEGQVSNWIRRYQSFPWEESNSDQSNTQPSSLLSDQVISSLDSFLTALGRANTRQEQHILSFSKPTSSYPAEIDDRIVWEAVSQEIGALGVQGTLKGIKPTSSPEDDDGWSYEVAASTATLITILQEIRKFLAARLPAFDAMGYSAPTDPDNSGMLCIGLAVTAKKIANRLQWDLSFADYVSGHWIDDWIIEVIHPQWRRVRNWLIGVQSKHRLPQRRGRSGVAIPAAMKSSYNFCEFIAAYCSIMETIFREGLRASPSFSWAQHYGIKPEIWAATQDKIEDLNISLIRSESYGEVIGGSFKQYIDLFHRVAQQIISLLPAVTPRSKKSDVLQKQAQEIVESAVFGAFVPAAASNVDVQLLSWATQNEVLQQAVLPEVARVLYCNGPSTVNLAGPAQRSRALRQCVLLHEHFHAILETGLSVNGKTATGSTDAAAWSRATPLNESLAAWMEWHFVRQHGDLIASREEKDEVLKSLWAYVCCGDYPVWPYRGAERIEAIYTETGIDAVRSLIHRLRANPVSTQAEFDNSI